MEILEAIVTVDDLDSFVATLTEIGDRHGVAIQAFDARYVMGRDHLERAADLADRAFARGENVARDRSIELLLYAAGRRQINRALEMGVTEGTCPAVIAVYAPDENGRDADENNEADSDRESKAVAELQDLEAIEPARTLGEYDKQRVRSFFAITEDELIATSGTLSDLVVERVALLEVKK